MTERQCKTCGDWWEFDHCGTCDDREHAASREFSDRLYEFDLESRRAPRDEEDEDDDHNRD